MLEAADGERYEGLNLTPPAEGFEPYRHKNAGETKAGGWSGLYWARRNDFRCRINRWPRRERQLSRSPDHRESALWT